MRVAARCGKIAAMPTVAEPPSRSPSVFSPTSLAAFALLLAVAFTLSFTPLRASHDEWWHLKSGMWIDEHGLPEKDIFTYSAQDYAWHNHEWLAQIAMWRIYKFGELRGWGGVRMVIAFKAACVIAAFLGLGVFLAFHTGAPACGALAAAVACGLSRRTLYPRPPFITYALLALVLAMLIAWRDRRLRSPWLLLFAPIFALWANLHGGFMAGLLVGAAFWLECAADWALAAWRAEGTRAARRRLGWLTIVGLLSFAATFATPYGYHLYELASRVMSDARLNGIIAELLPPSWTHVWIVDIAAILLLCAGARPRSIAGFAIAAIGANLALFAARAAPIFIEDVPRALAVETVLHEILLIAGILLAAARSKEKVGLAQTLLAIFFAHQGVRHVRHLPLFGIVVAPMMAQALADWARHGALAWDAAWFSGRARSAMPQAVGAALTRSQAIAQAAALGALAQFAAFYLFFPGEASVYFSPESYGTTREAARKAPSLFQRNLRLLRGQELEAGEYPIAAVDFLVAARPPGPLFNGGNYAGYLIWRLSPEKYKVFTDNRYDIWGGDFIEDELDVLRADPGDAAAGRPDWRAILKKWDARTLFIPMDTRLQRTLTEEAAAGAGEWAQAWPNPSSPPGEKFAIWTRKSGLNPPADPL